MSNKQFNKFFKLSLLVSFIVLLSACGNINEPITSQSTNFWDQFILFPLSQFIIWLSHLMGNNFGLGIIIFTLLVRILLIPLTLMQMKSQSKMMELQPEIDAIKEKYPNKDRHSMELLQAEQQALFEKKGVNQYAGCLPTLLQFPIMIILYQVISRTELLRQGHFLWVDLGQPDPYFIFPLLAALFTFLTTYLNSKTNPQQNISVKIMMVTMPLMIFFISFAFPSAISLYWFISNLITVIIILIFNNPYKIIKERQERIAQEKEKERQLRKALKKAKSRK
ncbi:membrane protein insertase YidC [Facklamia miroungae]|uniref:Membrane protein insertase YidC n=1 Tax=Facklamia miroungae TaxID=120956 RepID=A0A1G7SZL3_9LACT|nr:membrane protein insertase YidC [Facklamia miroungae]NKZ29493.1 membrane protein insertase YidC [Facklamia miroungae]SDG27839.1 YidC/Oxa1 family membrane protein insertase [Facklamia miroungae]